MYETTNLGTSNSFCRRIPRYGPHVYHSHDFKGLFK